MTYLNLYPKHRRNFNPYNLIWIILALLVLMILMINPAKADEININALANAIYRAENSKTHPYGILAHYKHTTPRQACINTIKNAIRRYEKTNKRSDFITFLSLTYCPIGAMNDPRGLNKNWVKNVRYYYTKLK